VKRLGAKDLRPTSQNGAVMNITAIYSLHGQLLAGATRHRHMNLHVGGITDMLDGGLGAAAAAR